MALPSYGGGMGRVYLCAAITLSPSAADMGGFFHAILVRVCLGETDDSTDQSGGTAPNRLRAVTPHFYAPGLCLSRNQPI